MTRDDAVVGEAAGLSMGLVMLGTQSPQAIDDMTNVSDMGNWNGTIDIGMQNIYGHLYFVEIIQ